MRVTAGGDGGSGGGSASRRPTINASRARAALALGQDDERIDVDTVHHVRVGGGEAGEGGDGARQRIDVAPWPAAGAFEQRGAPEPGDHPLRLLGIDRGLAERDFVDHLGQDPAPAHHHHRPERRIAPRAEDALDAAHHGGDDGAPDLGIRVVCPDARDQRIVLARGVLRRDAEGDRARLGLVVDVWREDLHRDRRADRPGGAGRLPGVARDARLHRRNAPRGKEPQRLALVEPATGVTVSRRMHGRRRGHRSCRRRRQVTISRRMPGRHRPRPFRRLCPEPDAGPAGSRRMRNGVRISIPVRIRPGRLRETLRGPCEGRHRAHRPHRIFEHRHVQRLVGRDRVAGADHRHEDRPAWMPLAGPGQRLQDGLRHEPHRRHVGEEDEDRAIVAVIEHRIEEFAHEMRGVEHLRGDVDRVARGAERDLLLQAALRRLRHRRDFEPPRRRLVGHQHAGAPRDGHDPDAAVRGQGAEARGVGRVEHLFGVAGANDAVLGEDRVEDGIGAGERRGMRSGRFGAHLGSPGLGEEYALPACPRRVERAQQGVAVPHSLRVSRHHVDLRAARHPRDALGRRHVALVAGGRPEPHADAAPVCEEPEVRAVRAALAHDGDRAGLRAMEVEGGSERREVADGGVVYAETVGAQDAHAARPRDLAHPPLASRAVRVRLGEARREHDRRFHAASGARFEGFEGDAGGHRHDGDVDLPGRLADVRIRLDPLHPVAARIDRPDRALESGFLQVA